jgi:hypothetical protein
MVLMGINGLYVMNQAGCVECCGDSGFDSCSCLNRLLFSLNKHLNNQTLLLGSCMANKLIEGQLLGHDDLSQGSIKH